ncbi:class I SAM-dependent methyltransferase [Rhodopirellula sp. JC740]|uniref:Class I SAM-dependent methyltransferase n=1 Tax=Rhodopirellula halodulae TaxID=2894198 RepID=A0ABS8NI33_9BACT|nr:class I SAM-dependent methyltransferase [Rhodopirellula sp. JC740]MCC9643191.1 class I SAM-dependent methyltransferase [Rhodopirellula sp. JC740]
MSRFKPSQFAGQHLGEQALHSNSDGYQLLDFGDGRKLELVAGRMLDRPSPAAEGFVRQQPARWSKADSRFETKSKRWTHRTRWNASTMSCGGFQMPVGPTPYGHIGVFPEQAPNWHWLRTQKLPAISSDEEQPRALNLFAYTGASTMALVSAGFAVAHVDAAKPNVQSAREAAAANGWPEPPIRFLVDDAVKFAAREVRRENRYHTIVMDPPAYGHGPSGKAWRLSRDMWPLIDDCLKLLDPTAFRMLITGHSPDVNQHDVQKYLDQNLRRVVSPSGEVRFKVGRLRLPDANGRELDAGFFVRVWNE